VIANVADGFTLDRRLDREILNGIVMC